MPSTYAHRRFGTNVLEHLPDELRAQLEQNRELYDIGLHGPDLLFYYHAARQTGMLRWHMRWALCATLRWTAHATRMWSSSPGKAV